MILSNVGANPIWGNSVAICWNCFEIWLANWHVLRMFFEEISK